MLKNVKDGNNVARSNVGWPSIMTSRNWMTPAEYEIERQEKLRRQKDIDSGLWGPYGRCSQCAGKGWSFKHDFSAEHDKKIECMWCDGTGHQK